MLPGAFIFPATARRPAMRWSAPASWGDQMLLPHGPVIIPLTKNGDTYTVPDGRKLTQPQMDALKSGNLYVNVHSPQNKGGEVRAQLQP